jgi:hypothetical protein
LIDEIVLKTIVSEAVRQVWKAVTGLLGSKPSDEGSLVVRTEGSERAIAHHLSFIERWSGQITLKDLPESRSLSDLFITLHFAQGVGKRMASRVDLDYLASPGLNKIVLGHPGAGKTTTIKYLCQRTLHEPDDRDDAFGFPVLIRFVDLRPGTTLIEHLLGLLGIEVGLRPAKGGEPQKAATDDSPSSQQSEKGQRNNDTKEDHDATQQQEKDPLSAAKERILIEFLNKARVLLLLDGLDEIEVTLYSSTLTWISRLANLLDGAAFVLTCRICAFRPILNAHSGRT